MERTGRGVREKKERGGWGENGEKEGERDKDRENIYYRAIVMSNMEAKFLWTEFNFTSKDH